MSDKIFDIAIYVDRLVTMNSKRDVIFDAVVGISGNIISFIGSNQQINAKKTIRKTDSVLMPGLVNTHTHVPMTLMRGVADDFKLMDWLQNYIFPIESKFVSEEFVYWGSKLAALELISSGTTTFCDMFYHTPSIGKAMDQAGMRALLAHDCGMPYLQHLSQDERLEKGLELSAQYYQEFKKYDRLKIALGPHSPYSVSNKKYLRKISELAQELNIPISIHIAETKYDVDIIEKSTGEKMRSSIQYLHDIDFYDARVLSVHTIWTDEKDLEILAKKNVHVAHCPQSNLKLGSGIAAIEKMIEKGIVVGLGSDGPASNNDMILWEEMNLAAILHKGKTLDPTVIPAQKAFEMATIDGAKALWMDKEIGSVEVGKKADLVLVDTSSPHQYPPSQNIYSQLVYSTKSSDVDSVVIDGQVVYENKKFLTLNQSEIYSQTKEIRNKIDHFIKSK